MPRKTCAACGCLNTSRRNPHLTFFTLPADHNRRSVWLQLMSREDLMGRTPRYSVVCEAHFEPRYILMNANRKVLKKDAIPSLHLLHYVSAPLQSRGTQTGDGQPNRTADTCTQTVNHKTSAHTQTTKCRKRLKSEDEEDAENVLYTFHKLCDRFLTKELAEHVKERSQVKLYKYKKESILQKLLQRPL